MQSALEFADGSEGALDLLLTDVMLEDGTGPRLAEKYVRVRADTKVLFMSGYSDEEALQEVEHMDGATFLEKPFTLQTLAEKVAEAMAGPSLKVNEPSV